MAVFDWHELAELAIARIKASGAEYGDIRLLDSTVQSIAGEDRRISSVRESNDRGFGIRVLYHGGWGFAASSICSVEEVPRVADLAVEIARGSSSLAIEKVKLADEPVHHDSVATAMRIDPFVVSLEKKTDLLLETMEVLHQQAGVVRTKAGIWACRDRKLF
ncbi:MAG TPA: DNA gyrase modulator, partial [Nitrospiraceae bacterium]